MLAVNLGTLSACRGEEEALGRILQSPTPARFGAGPVAGSMGMPSHDVRIWMPGQT